jgi:short-subunit dehydrogenase involved in D-alanine esterification of teichoic acids
MEEIEKTLKKHTWNEDSTIHITLNSSCKNMLKEFLPLFRRYTNAIIINYKEGLSTSALINIGNDTIALA